MPVKTDKLVEQEEAQSCPPPEFLLSSRMLEADGYVQRFDSHIGPNLYSTWITPRGLDRAEYLQLGRIRRSIRWLQGKWADALLSVVTSAVTTLVTVLTMRFLGLFGLSE